MNLRVWLVSVGALLAIGGAFFAWRASAARRETLDALALALTERQQAAAELKRRQAPAAPKPANPAAATPAASSFAVPHFLPTPDDSAGQARRLAIRRTQFFRKYGSFYRTLGLSAAQVAAFEDLLAGHEGRRLDIDSAENGLRVDPAIAAREKRTTADGREVFVLVDPSIAALRHQEDARLAGAELALLGESGFARLLDYEASAESRGFVDELTGNLTFTASPLSADQGRQLLQLLQVQHFTTGAGADAIDWTTIRSQAQAFLDSRQFAELAVLATHAQGAASIDRLSGIAKRH